jgi:hypothetical protein
MLPLFARAVPSAPPLGAHDAKWPPALQSLIIKTCCIHIHRTHVYENAYVYVYRLHKYMYTHAHARTHTKGMK